MQPVVERLPLDESTETLTGALVLPVWALKTFEATHARVVTFAQGHREF